MEQAYFVALAGTGLRYDPRVCLAAGGAALYNPALDQLATGGTDALGDPRVAAVVCGWAGDDTRHVRHTPMAHVFLRDGEGVVLRSRFWLGAALRPYLPGPLAAAGAALLNRRAVRRGSSFGGWSAS